MGDPPALRAAPPVAHVRACPAQELAVLVRVQVAAPAVDRVELQVVAPVVAREVPQAGVHRVARAVVVATAKNSSQWICLPTPRRTVRYQKV